MNKPEQNTILIVDDMPNNLGALLNYLTDFGFEVLVAEDGESAIEQVEYALPDLILLDVLMPGIDGFETCSRLKSNQATKDIPVIFMTALTDAEDKVKGFSVGGVDYVTKPIQQAEVLARVTTHLSIRNLQKKLQQQNDRLQQEICDRIKIEQQLQIRTAQLETANQELEAFSYSVAHDLRNPITSINGYIWVLEEEYAYLLDEDGKHYLERVRIATERMEQLIDDILRLSQVTKSKMQFDTVDLSRIAKEIVISLRQTSKEREVEFIIPEGIVAQGDEQLLKIVLENLLCNAWKYTRNKPRARIEFGVFQQGINTQSSVDTYFVRDDGAGFDMAKADKLFGAFSRLHGKNEFEGTGIGLATVQRIVHRHGGKIWADGEVNKGATFYFTLG
ncbi:MAG TPA: hybrid sensor histidine kinase/response regulator [Cyanobacteria bacterium UBA11369]|nr:hybrid sensor histidine kinase/response regulator [Cyanobacteria bacterium UBA11371]HBE33208.1 hybrid sensor histidine kinase/response regulator [Cyanobacteria bacterium UBA11368]HBE50846.1 hybrid sensor histidine kinase/response regulator [Cyanobacteria bacterium UBA11369]